MKEQRKSLTNFILMLLPPLSSSVLSVVAYFAAFMLTYLISFFSTEIATDEWGVNVPIFLLFRNLIMLIIFASWYYNFILKPAKKHTDPFEAIIESFSLFKKRLYFIPVLVAAGYILQLLTTLLLRYLSTLMPELMKSYTESVSSLIGGTASLLTVFTVTFISPIAEEIMFRGLSQKYAERAFGALPAIFIQAALFGIYHMNIIQGIYAFLFGILFGFMAHKSKSLMPSILLHAVINLSAYLIP